MRIRTPDYYDKFKCIDKKCTDTCCAGWEVDLDKASVEYYKSVEGEFGERLKSVMVFEEGEDRFKLRPNGRCPFLNDENLCDLYIAFGEEKLCKTCTEHPRYMSEYGDLQEWGISISCPEAARIILSDKKTVSFNTVLNETPAPQYSNLDPQKYVLAVRKRKEAYGMAQDRSKGIHERLRLILEEGIKVQEELSKRVVNKSSDKKITKRQLILEWITHIHNYECVNPYWNELISSEEQFLLNLSDDREYDEYKRKFEEYYASSMYEYEQILVYFLYRYYVTCVFDVDLLSKLKLAAMCIIMCETMAIDQYSRTGHFKLKDQIEIIHCFSRQFEHSDENAEAINHSFRNEEIFDIEHFLDYLR